VVRFTPVATPSEGESPSAGAPPIGDLPTPQPIVRNPVDLKVAAVLARRPFGVRSVEEIGRLAGVSPSAATRALQRLEREAIVVRRTDMVAAGNARRIGVWTIDWRSAGWHAVAARVGRVSLPTPSRRRRSARLPQRLAHLFWNADVDQLDPKVHGHLVASRILRSDDCQALGWLARALQPGHILAATNGRGLDRRRATLGRLLAEQR
jgi:hypothetical protein